MVFLILVWHGYHSNGWNTSPFYYFSICLACELVCAGVDTHTQNIVDDSAKLCFFFFISVFIVKSSENVLLKSETLLRLARLLKDDLV